MFKWTANWSGAIKSFPGLENLVPHFEELEQVVKEHVAKIEQSVLTYFSQHAGDNGSLSIDASVDPQGEHSAAVTIAAIPQATNIPPAGGAEPDASAAAASESETPAAVDQNGDKFVLQAVGNGVSLVFGAAKGQPFSTRQDADGHKAAFKDDRVGATPTINVVEVTAEQVQSLDIEGIPE